MAVGLACLMWVTFGYQRDIVRRDMLVPIEYKNIPEHWQLDEPQVTEAKIIMQGPEQAFRLLHERSLRLSLDLTSITEKKREFALVPNMLNAPPNLSVTDIIPGKIRVSASRMVPATVTLSVATRNALPAHLALQKITLIPGSVPVMLDPRLKPEELRLAIEPIDLSQIAASITMETKVAKAAGVSFPDGNWPSVRAIIRVKKK